MNSLNLKSNPNLIATLAAALLPLGQTCWALNDAPAVPGAPSQSTTVRFADLNLSNPEGARVLYGRIRLAAQSLCGEQSSFFDIKWMFEYRQCYREAVDRAVRQINRPTLTAVHAELTKQSHSARPPVLSQTTVPHQAER